MSDGLEGERNAVTAVSSEKPRPRGTGLGGAPSLTLGGASDHFEDEFDALADLFLSDGAVGVDVGTRSDGGHAPRADVDRPAVEGLIVGHLPVSASSWVKTYAAMRARALGGPVGLIRVLGGTMMIDLVGVDSRGASDSPEALDAALDCLRTRGVGVVVRVDEINEPDLVGGSIDGLVVLSGADEAAIVGAFRTIKSLVGEDSRGIEAPAIRAAIFGVGRAEAGEAFERLARSVRHSLSCEINFAGSVERIVSEPSAALYHGPWEGSLGVLLDRLAIGQQRGLSASEGERLAGLDAEQARGEGGRASDVPAEDWLAHSAPQAQASDAPIGSKRGDDSPGAGATPAPDREEVSGKESGKEDASRAEPEVGTTVDSADEQANRADFVGLIDGLLACAIRCPDDLGVEVAIDRDGGLVVVTDDLARGEGVLAWAHRHAALIRMAEARVRMVREGVTLVVKDARGARALLDSRHRIMLLVELGGTRGCVALN